MLQTPLRLLSVSFTLPADYTDAMLPKLRGAIAAKAGLEHDEFHNHNNAEGATVAFHYRYPLVQYHVKDGVLRLVCWNKGIDALQHFFAQPDWTLELHTGQSVTLRINNMQLRELLPTVAPTERRYRIRNWYALNQENFKLYINAAEAEQHALLQRLLVNQIVLLLSSIGFPPTAPITVTLHSLRSHVLTHKKQKVRVFHPEFSCNAVLPIGLGIGKASAMGFGEIHPRKTEEYRVIPQKYRNAVAAG